MPTIIYAWFGVTLKGNIYQGVAHGVADAVGPWSESEIHLADSARSGVDACVPPSKHVTKEGFDKAIMHMRKGECGTAGDMIENYRKPEADEACISCFKMAIVLVCRGTPELLRNALPTTYY